MSPEQVDGGEVDGRSDLFAVGIVVYEMLAGRRPFSGASDAELVARVMAANVRPLRELRPEIPEDVAAVVEKLLQRDPQARFQTPLEALQALNACAIFRADPVGMGTWLSGLFPDDAVDHSTRATRSETGGRTDPSSEGVAATALAVTQTSDAERPTARSRPRRSRAWIGVAPLVAGLAVVGAMVLRQPRRVGKPPVAAPPTAAVVVPAPTSTPEATPSPPPPAAAPVAAPAPEKRKPTAAKSRARARARAGPSGFLKVGIVPWVDVRIDGKRYGTSPLTIPLPVGSYKVDLSGPGGKRQERVEIKAGQTTSLTR